jgi:phosphoserine phosphatase
MSETREQLDTQQLRHCVDVAAQAFAGHAKTMRAASQADSPMMTAQAAARLAEEFDRYHANALEVLDKLNDRGARVELVTDPD